METLQKIACLRQFLGKVVCLDDKDLAPRAVGFIQDYQDIMADRAFLRTGDLAASSTCLMVSDRYVSTTRDSSYMSQAGSTLLNN